LASILALNSGSSSVKFALFDGEVATMRGLAENIGAGLTPRLMVDGRECALPADARHHASIIAHLIDAVVLPAAGNIAGVGHRVVHGGMGFVGPERIDATVRVEIAALSQLAPAHQPHNIAGIDAVSAALPGVSQVACFDTAFHRTIPEHRQLMALPKRYADEGLRRFGFHGISYEGVVEALPKIVGSMPKRVVACHLGNGCSLAGMVDGRSQFTSMGFTPLDGLIMGRRPGRLDPGAVLWLVERHGGDIAAVRHMLNQQSGMLGISGLSPDMRTLIASPDPAAELAVAMFVDRLAQEIGAAVAAIGGLDALVFTGGIGENAAVIRSRTVAALAFLGVSLDDAANAVGAPTLTTAGSRPAVHIVRADEEATIARATDALVGGRNRP